MWIPLAKREKNPRAIHRKKDRSSQWLGGWEKFSDSSALPGEGGGCLRHSPEIEKKYEIQRVPLKGKELFLLSLREDGEVRGDSGDLKNQELDFIQRGEDTHIRKGTGSLSSQSRLKDGSKRNCVIY